MAFALLAGPALAQSPVPPSIPASPAAPLKSPKDVPIPNRSITLTAQQGYIIRENVIPGGAENTNKSSEATTGSSGDTLKIGGKAPSSAALKDFPDLVQQKVPAVKTYKYLIADNRVVIVNPKDNTIADILK